MKIAFLEPFYTGSHKFFADELKNNSCHDIKILKMEGRLWKWRMHGGAVELARVFNESNEEYDIILATDMVDLTTFLSLTRHKTSNIKTAIYFHENQLTYPWSEKDPDRSNKRDEHYAFINYTSSLCADMNWYNSNYNMESYLKALESLLKRFPDYNNIQTVNSIRNKSKVLPLGLSLNRFDKCRTVKNNIPKILWNHRWEYDKNPDEFFKALIILKEKGLEFEVIVLGENYKHVPGIFSIAKEKLKGSIKFVGYITNDIEYGRYLHEADILPVTSNQEFFGISVMEAIYCGAYPLLPKRLTYPDLIPIQKYKNNFYDNFEDLVNKLEYSILNIDQIRDINMRNVAGKYDWSSMIKVYDEKFSELVTR